MALKFSKISQFREFPPMCAARGKIILTLAVYTYKYLLHKFHEIIFQIDQTAVV